MTKDEAYALARAEVARTGAPRDIWEHVGGKTPTGVIMPQGRFVSRSPDVAPPRWCWEKVGRVDLPQGASDA